MLLGPSEPGRSTGRAAVRTGLPAARSTDTAGLGLVALRDITVLSLVESFKVMKHFHLHEHNYGSVSLSDLI